MTGFLLFIPPWSKDVSIWNLDICHTNKIQHFHSSNIPNEKKKEYSNVCLTILATTKNEVAQNYEYSFDPNLF
jgi:hypothetical protein